MTDSGSSPRADRSDPDARATRRASLVIGWQIMAASAVLVLGIVVIGIVFLLHQALPREQIDLEHSSSHVYVDSSDVMQALVLLGAGAVVFAGLVSWFVARRAVKPLGTALRLQRQFVADASHELRTPLAVLDARIQVLQRRLDADGAPDPASTRQTVAELRSDSRALIDIVNDLLLAAGGDRADSAAIDAAPVVAEAVRSLEILARDRGVTLEITAQEPGRVAIPAAALRRCTVALVDNAIGHSPRGGTVRVSASVAGASFALRVADDGPGITGIAPERVFDRFAHSAPSGDDGRADGPTANRQSFGIGLSLVRDIAERQGGRVRVESTSSAGTTMAFELPLAR
ncbi:sensor histidine kinase [Frondihabitans australicus]|uniref:histidine kinase n=1 Tax=Frondihabitans australicus TaxID=386892 RepID=A0A495IEE7_9MICO|nr:HAMP domain-containing sensor histidine kinase [Frondihabitans australicus]RKR73721.1 phospho-acceptor domain-containing protein [Frondihabitans australicus]